MIMIKRVRFFKDKDISALYIFNKFDNYHNKTGPAAILYSLTGDVRYKYHYVNNVLHNTKKFAFEAVHSRQYFYHGEFINVNSKKEFLQKIKLLNLK